MHYPGDILGGIIVGVLAGWLVWLLMRWIQRRWHIHEGRYTRSDATVMTMSLGITLIGLVTTALIQTC